MGEEDRKQAVLFRSSLFIRLDSETHAGTRILQGAEAAYEAKSEAYSRATLDVCWSVPLSRGNSGLRRSQYDDCFYLWRAVLIRVDVHCAASSPVSRLCRKLLNSVSMLPRFVASVASVLGRVSHKRQRAYIRVASAGREIRPRASWNPSLFAAEYRGIYLGLFFSARDPALQYRATFVPIRVVTHTARKKYRFTVNIL